MMPALGMQKVTDALAYEREELSALRNEVKAVHQVDPASKALGFNCSKVQTFQDAGFK